MNISFGTRTTDIRKGSIIRLDSIAGRIVRLRDSFLLGQALLACRQWRLHLHSCNGCRSGYFAINARFARLTVAFIAIPVQSGVSIRLPAC